jgi:hypothetical protein
MAYERAGRLEEVVDILIEETARGLAPEGTDLLEDA